jgi:photosystem II stability/assembly factor-like uncharacterized protein
MIGILLAGVLAAQAGAQPRDAAPARQVTLPAPFDAAAGRWRSAGPSGGVIYSVAVDPTDARVEYVAVGSDFAPDPYGIGGIFRSADGGSHWTEIGPPEKSFFTVSVAPSDRSLLFASSDDGLWRSGDGGVTWQMVLPGFSFPAPATVDPNDALHVWVVSDFTAWRSLDGGTTWSKMFTAYAVGFDSGTPSRLHRAQIDTFGPSDVVELHFGYSDDRGETWTTSASTFRPVFYILPRLVSDPSDPSRIYTAGEAFRTTDRGVSWARLPGSPLLSDVAVDPRLSHTLYEATSDGLFVSHDDSATWTLALDVPLPSVAAAALEDGTRVFAGTPRGFYSSDDLETWIDRNPGLRGAQWLSIAVTHGNSSALYAIGTEGLAVSSDEGASWRQRSLSAPVAGSAVAVSPADPARILASGSSAGIERSMDGGATWETVFSPGSNASAIVFDLANPSIVYATVFYPLKSTDGGETWHNIYRGVESFASGPIAIDSGDSARLYLIANSRFLFRSVDAGESWVLDNGLDSTYATLETVLADPARPGVVWLGTTYGLLRGGSSDAAWTPTSFMDPVSAIASDPTNGALYLASNGAGIYRSLDEGLTWKPMGSGFPPVSVSVLVVDSASGTLYAGAGDGVYALDLRRHPNVVTRP